MVQVLLITNEVANKLSIGTKIGDLLTSNGVVALTLFHKIRWRL